MNMLIGRTSVSRAACCLVAVVTLAQLCFAQTHQAIPTVPPDQVDLAFKNKLQVFNRRMQVILVPGALHFADNSAEYCLDQILLRAEVIMKVSPADAAVVRYPVRRNRTRTVLVKELDGGTNDQVLGFSGGH